MKRNRSKYARSARQALALVLSIGFVFSAVMFVHAQVDEEEFVQEGVVSSTDEPDPDPFRLFLEAQDAHEQGDLDKALELYGAALAALPEFPEAEYQRAVIYQGRGLLDKAETSFRKALEFRPDWTLAMAGLGSVLVSRGNYDDAEMVLGNAIKLDSMSIPAYVALTNSYLARPTSGEQIKALYSKLVYVTSKSNIPAAVWSSRASLARILGNFEDARESIRRSLAIEPNNKPALFEDAEVSIAVMDYEGAISRAVSLVARYPEDFGAKILMARGHALKGNTEKALEILDSISDDSKHASEIAAAIRSSVLKLDIPALEAALAETPGDVRLLGELCVAYRRGDPKKALEYCRKASELEPTNISHAVGFGAALVQMREFKSAVVVLERLKEVDGENHTVRTNLATAYFQLGKFENAKPEYRWIVDKQPGLPAGYYFLAITHDRLSEYTDAMANYQQFMRIADPTEFEDEIGRVRLRLTILQKQINKGKKN